MHPAGGTGPTAHVLEPTVPQPAVPRPMTAAPAPAPALGRLPVSQPPRITQRPNSTGSTIRRRTDARHRAGGSRVTPVIVVSWLVIAVAIGAIVAMLAFRG